jgi:hypothetical protein
VVIAGHASGGLLQLAGFLIGVVMLLLSLSGGLDQLGRLIPHCVVRGIQAGLGLSLAGAATGLVAQPHSTWAWVVALAAVAVLALLRTSHRLPGALLVVGVASLWAAIYRVDWTAVRHATGFVMPHAEPWPWNQWLTALTLLVLPQLPLSLTNSVIATQQTVRDLFPGRDIPLRKIGLTYSGINLITPWFGGLPACHGCGGLAGYYALGARTGGAVIFCGTLYLVAGLFFSGTFTTFIHAFPSPVLGAVLLVEATVLVLLMRDLRSSTPALALAVGVAGLCLLVPQGYLAGLLAGTAGYYGLRRFGIAFDLNQRPAGIS